MVAILLSSENTTKEEATGLAAHGYLIIQLSQDLQGSQWLQYDQNFREWATAKGLRIWSELNLTTYGRCLACHQPPIIGSKRKLKYQSVSTGMQAPHVRNLPANSLTSAVPMGEVECPKSKEY